MWALSMAEAPPKEACVPPTVAASASILLPLCQPASLRRRLWKVGQTVQPGSHLAGRLQSKTAEARPGAGGLRLQ